MAGNGPDVSDGWLFLPSLQLDSRPRVFGKSRGMHHLRDFADIVT